MDKGLNYLQTFNPVESKPELLEHTLVGRKDLVDRLEELVIESTQTGNKLQRLIIGSRGSGKTHALKVLHNRIFNRRDLVDNLVIAYLCEDEYGVATFLDWIIRILRSFIRWDPEKAAYLENEIEKLKKVHKGEWEKIAANLLLNYIKGKTLLIIVENIGNIFHKKKGFGKKGQQKFRDLIQQYPFFIIMASNQALFEDIQKEDMPFHNFFKIIHLRKLSLKETFFFLKTIAEWDKNTKLLPFLDTHEGRGRIKAIYDLIGGNHRLLVTFYHFLKTDFINKLSESFMKTINDLTPYYQSMMDSLTAQQQKIVQYLCQVRTATNVKNISENCFSTQNTISKQMINLIRLKYVDAIPSGRETFYELSEPLLRICNEVKENRGGPIKLFIDFLGNLYSVEEIKRKYMHYHILYKILEKEAPSDFYEEHLYYKETIKRYFPGLLKTFQIDTFEGAPKDEQIKTYIEDLEKSGIYTEILKFTSKIQEKDRYILLKEASAYRKTGDIEKAIETAKNLLNKNEKDIDALLMLAEAYQQNDKLNESNKYFNKVLENDEKNIKALAGIGKNLFIEEKYEEAKTSYIKAIDLDKENADAIEALGVVFGNQGDHQQAYNSFKDLTDLKPEYSHGWWLLGRAQENLNNIEEAKTSYIKAIDLDKENADAIKALGVVFGNQGDHQQAYNSFKDLTDLKPEYSHGWWLLGRSQEGLNKIEEAKTSYLKAIDLDEKNTDAIQYLGIVLGNQGDHKQAYNYFKRLTDLKPDYSHGWFILGWSQEGLNKIEEAKTSYIKAIDLDKKNTTAVSYLSGLLMKENSFEKALSYIDKALKETPIDSQLLNMKGEIYRKSDQFEKAVSFYKQAIQAGSKSQHPSFNLVSCYLGLNDITNALSQLEKSLKLANEINLTDQTIQNFEENTITLFIHVYRESIPFYLNEALALVEKYSFTDQFYKSIPETIFGILKQHDRIETVRFEFIETYLSDKFKDNELLIVPLKFLNIGIRHLKKNEKNALLLFTKEERATFKKFVLNQI
ncbi:MAG: tetratricopeptide repeat protein [Proteobacteria bacterium]|nr:tetratricopeptide repeat protein [Desulfobacteraceae bacterium]MBU4100080.1 tetratricopeptide repeat protein [Pseudomonadota bacterium]